MGYESGLFECAAQEYQMAIKRRCLSAAYTLLLGAYADIPMAVLLRFVCSVCVRMQSAVTDDDHLKDRSAHFCTSCVQSPW